MDNIHDRQAERLEDQLRRMILTNDLPPSNAQPTVRLPPSSRIPPHLRPPWEASYYSNQHGSPEGVHAPNRNFEQPQQPSPPTQQHYGPQEQDARNQRPVQRPHQKQSGPPNFRPNQRQFYNRPQSSGSPAPSQRARNQQQMQLDPNAFQRGGFGQPYPRQHHGSQQLFNPNAPISQHPPHNPPPDWRFRQAQYLEQVASSEIHQVEMSLAEREEKESFRVALEQICHEVCAAAPERLPRVSLECFGSFQSGFATAGSDMDLVIVVNSHSPTSVCFSLLEDDLPRALEKRLLQLGYGARLLTRTRVPIIKICEKPTATLLEKLREERENWDALPHKTKYPHLHQQEEVVEGGDDVQAGNDTHPEAALSTPDSAIAETKPKGNRRANRRNTNGGSKNKDVIEGDESTENVQTPNTPKESENGEKVRPKRDDSKPWTRERTAGPLDFPKSGVGIQSDINFFNPLGLHNTHLLACYALCDSRVRPMVLFIKAWAKRRKINSSYSGTLSSYGYVLMVIHYLVNVAQPPVLPNLQGVWRPVGMGVADSAETITVEGWPVFFWRNEAEIRTAAQRGMLTSNQDSLGSLLAGFFLYYASPPGVGGRTFRWMQEVLSLRSVASGGLLSKEEKGWVKAVTEEGEGKKIQHRYLFCIEDPFELNHNVARTVTHNGIVAIRDEFRRARRILLAVGNGAFNKDGELFAQMIEEDGAAKGDEFRGYTTVHNDGRAQLPFGSKAQDRAPGPFTAKTQDRNAGQFASKAQHRFTHSNDGIATPKHGPHGPRRQNGLSFTPATKERFDVHDNDAFPSLGAGKPTRKKDASVGNAENWGEISGDKARMVLEEVKRKKDEAQAESTATGAAEAVLGDSD